MSALPVDKLFILFQMLFSFVIAMALNQTGPMNRLFCFIISKIAVSEEKKSHFFWILVQLK
jgi:hypothetical protein